MLYIRMLLTMLVSLYTVRVVLKTLGVNDYGIYSVVGGVVEMFAFLSNTMASASERFFAYEIGKNNIVKLKQTFSLTMLIYGIMAIIILLIAETGGLWFLNHKMTIPPERLDAANWVFQFAILSFILTILTVPYNAIIIAREDMKFYAYVSIIEVGAKLGIVYMLYLFDVDKLKLYGFLILVTTFIITLISRTFCQRKYAESKFNYYWDKSMFKTLVSYSSWNLFGAITGVANNNGLNILLNIFFGPAVNAARAVAYRVSVVIASFSTNFYTAVTPQIVKSYAAGDINYLLSLVFNSSKYSFYLLLLISMPFLIELEFILKLWLGDVSSYMVIFTRLALIYALVNSLENPLTQTVRATGSIKWYQIIVGSFTLLLLPICYVFFKLKYPPETSFYILIAIYTLALFLRLYVLKKLIKFSINDYLSQVLLKVLIVTIVSASAPLLLKNYISSGVLQFFIVEFTTVVWLLITIYVLGLTSNERNTINEFVKKFLAGKSAKPNVV